MDSTTLKQGGFGIFVGYHAGVQGTKTWVSTITQEMCFDGFCTPPTSRTSQSSNTDFSQGPVLSLSFPSYNAGTAHLSRAYLTFMALPTGSFFFATVSGGCAF
jgi:hypothetical protein